MTDESKIKLDLIFDKVIGVVQLLALAMLVFMSIPAVLADVAQRQDEPQQHQDVTQQQDYQNQRLTKLETQLEDKIREVDKDTDKVDKLQERVIRVENDYELILRLLYGISTALGAIVIETAHRMLRPALKKGLL